MIVEVKGTRLTEEGPKAGMLIDYGDLTVAVRPVLDGVLDHHYLNETTGITNPTSEELARWLFSTMRKTIAGLSAIEIHETCTSACRYEEGK
jgi:6-pyruvoyltetrahydropterin/6-carboxytetrahydropterin synthase